MNAAPRNDGIQSRTFEENVSSLNHLFFSWAGDIISLFRKENTPLEKLPALTPSNGIRTVYNLYRECVYKSYPHNAADEDSFRGGFYLGRTLLYLVHSELLLSGLFSLIHIVSLVGTPLLIRKLVDAIAADEVDGAYYAIGLAAVAFVGNMANQHQIHETTRLAQRLRTAMVTAVYRKALSAPVTTIGWSPERAKVPPQVDVQSILSSDAEKFLTTMPLLHSLWTTPAIIIASTVFLYEFLGPSALAGISGMVVLLLPVQSILLRLQTRSRRVHLRNADERNRIVEDALSGMKVVKLLAWEAAWARRLEEIRSAEVRAIGFENLYFALNSTMTIWCSVIAMAITFSVYTALGHTLDAGTAFASLSFFNVLRFPIQNMGNVLNSGAQMVVSVQRMSRFLGSSGGLTHMQSQEQLPEDVYEFETAWGDDNSSPYTTDDSYVHVYDNAVAAEVVSLEEMETESVSVLDQSLTSTVQRSNMLFQNAPVQIDLQSATFQWRGSAFHLKGITLKVRRGEHISLTGSVGAGKSSLLLALLGEMSRAVTPKESLALQQSAFLPCGRTKLAHKVGYVPQIPWILHGTIRDNILFGLPFDEKKYREVLTACCLWKDIESFRAGESTVIGERGVTLSGGQKTRICLARAVYRCPDLLFADDPLSALDAETQLAVWNRLFCPIGGLLAKWDVTVLHATHSPLALPTVDRILFLRGGEIIFDGTFASLSPMVRSQEPATRSSNPSISSSAAILRSPGVTATPRVQVRSAGSPDSSPSSITMDHSVKHTLETFFSSISSLFDTARLNGSASAKDLSMLAMADEASPEDEEDERRFLEELATPLPEYKPDKLHSQEERASGSVGMHVVLHWVYAGGGWFLTLFLFASFVFERLAYIAFDAWLSLWTSANDPDAVQSTSGFSYFSKYLDENTDYVMVYGIICGLSLLGAFMRTSLFSLLATRASKELYQSVLWPVLRSPMRFFETTPLGRVISRLTYDVEILDSGLLQKATATTASMFWIVTAAAIMITVVPWSAFLLVAVLVFYTVLMRYVRPALRDLQRHDALTRSPLASHVSESLAGTIVIRAHGMTGRFVAECDKLLANNTRSTLAYQSCSRWLSTRLDMTGFLIQITMGLICWALRDKLPPGMAGLAIIWGTNITTSFQFQVQFFTQAEAAFVAIERILYYTGLLPEPKLLQQALPVQGKDFSDIPMPIPEQERSDPMTAVRSRAEIEEAVAWLQGRAPQYSIQPRSWPNRGSVEFHKVSLRYRKDLPLALADVSFRVAPGEFLGVVGRTGGGKSTLVGPALFRLVPYLAGGRILIDGYDTAQIGISQLRGSLLSCIPQEPILFRGSVRENLDPFGLCVRSEQGDQYLWNVLDAVQLSHVFLPIGLDAPINENTLSLGQKQCLCLARVILRRPKILVLDEATASVDSATDAIMMNAVRKLCKNSTIICVAHRLHTLTGADKILVMDKGSVAEFGSPQELIKNGGHFADLVRTSGPHVYDLFMPSEIPDDDRRSD